MPLSQVTPADAQRLLQPILSGASDDEMSDDEMPPLEYLNGEPYKSEDERASQTDLDEGEDIIDIDW